MKVVALISGGKDSCFNMMHCVAMGHQIVALANLQPKLSGEADSYMYQTVGHEGIDLYAKAMELPLFKRVILGESKSTDMSYVEEEGDEVEDLYLLLKEIKSKMDFEAVSCGAILSNYQRVRVENVCSRLNVCSLSYLWRCNQQQLLQDMVENQLAAVLVKVAALGLGPNHLGKTLEEMQNHLFKLNTKYGSHICGEGGEYETFTLNCPLFKKRIVIDDSEIVVHSNDYFAPVTYLKLKSFHLEDKNVPCSLNSTCLVPRGYSFASSASCVFSEKIVSKFSWVGCDVIKNESEKNVDSVKYRWSTKRVGSYFAVSCLCGQYSTGRADNGVKGYTQLVLSEMTELLQVNGHRSSHVCYVHLYVNDMSQFATVNSVYKTIFGHNPPARVCVAFNLEKSKSEEGVYLRVDCISCRSASQKEVMHVQGISHWAPANIGPYSQCVKQGNMYFVAGQIGLVPGSMKLVEGGAFVEANLALTHVQSVLEAMDPKMSIDDVIQCVCYVTNPDYIGFAKHVWERASECKDGLHSSVLYVVVPSLPRQASVEWQVVARRSCDINQVEFSDKDQVDGRTAVAFAHHTNVADNINLRKSLLAAFEGLQVQVQSHGYEWSSVLQMRLFFVSRNISIECFTAVWHELEEELQDIPSVCPVPVNAIFSHDSSTMKCMSAICTVMQQTLNT